MICNVINDDIVDMFKDFNKDVADVFSEALAKCIESCGGLEEFKKVYLLVNKECST